jgi:hypothetical protein
VPRPATGKTALRIFMGLVGYLQENAFAKLVGSRFAACNKGRRGEMVSMNGLLSAGLTIARQISSW